MILCLDIGNTQIYAGIYKNDICQFRFRLDTKQGWTSDQFGIFLCSFLMIHNITRKEIKRVAIASVAPTLDYSVRAACIKYLSVEPFFIKSGVKTGLHIRINNPNELGADIIAGAIAAVHHYPNHPLIIIDLGTATTFCCIADDKKLEGVVIAPGISTQMKSLHSNTEKLMAVELVKPQSIMGKSTKDSIQSGLYYGHLGMMHHIVNEITKLSKEKYKILGTGGFSTLFANENIFTTTYPDLVLEGILFAEKLNASTL